MAFVQENNENGEALDPYNLAPRERSRGNTAVKKSPKKIPDKSSTSSSASHGGKKTKTNCKLF